MAGPRLPRFVTVHPWTLIDGARSIQANCVHHRRLGGFVIWPIDRLIDYVTDLGVSLDDAYRESLCVLFALTLCRG